MVTPRRRSTNPNASSRPAWLRWTPMVRPTNCLLVRSVMACRMSSKSTAQGYPLRPNCCRLATGCLTPHGLSGCTLGRSPARPRLNRTCPRRLLWLEGTVAVPEEAMEKAISDFKDQHALLLTEIRRLSEEEADDAESARTRELRSILKVVFR